MSYRLLVDLEVISILDAMPKRIRMRLLDHFEQLRATPEQHSDYQELDSIGRAVEVGVFAGCCVKYWIDSADRHVKVLALEPAGE